jgi:hypothetical protein
MYKCCYLNDQEQEIIKAGGLLKDGQGCPKPATFEVLDLSDADPYLRATQSCEDHVGKLLGHRPDVTTPVDCWEVIALEQA